MSRRWVMMCRALLSDPGNVVATKRMLLNLLGWHSGSRIFRCPVCRSRVGAFKDIGPRNKPSGFEENLDFGLGVNRLTPGQKNVLIFGGFALAIAFFLSLYSLR